MRSLIISTKSEFQEWKSHPVTKEIMKQLKNRVISIQEELGAQAGNDPKFDRMMVGAVQAYNDLINISWSEEE